MARSNYQTSSIARQSVMLQRKFTVSIAIATTILFLCIESVRAFTFPVSIHSLSNENTVLSLASGVHSISRLHGRSKSAQTLQQRSPQLISQNTQIHKRFSITALRSSWSVPSMSDIGALAPESVSKTIEIFGGWYNEMDPVPMTYVYDDRQDDYSFVLSTSNWPTTTSQTVGEVEVLSKTFPKGIRPRPLRTFRRVAGWLNVKNSPLVQRKDMKRNML